METRLYFIKNHLRTSEEGCCSILHDNEYFSLVDIQKKPLNKRVSSIKKVMKRSLSRENGAIFFRNLWVDNYRSRKEGKRPPTKRKEETSAVIVSIKNLSLGT
jgi:hypothetical protein